MLEQTAFRLPDDVRKALFDMQGETGQNRTFLLCLAVRFYQKAAKAGFDDHYTKLKASYTKKLEKEAVRSDSIA